MIVKILSGNVNIFNLVYFLIYNPFVNRLEFWQIWTFLVWHYFLSTPFFFFSLSLSIKFVCSYFNVLRKETFLSDKQALHFLTSAIIYSSVSYLHRYNDWVKDFHASVWWRKLLDVCKSIQQKTGFQLYIHSPKRERWELLQAVNLTNKFSITINFIILNCTIWKMFA